MRSRNNKNYNRKPDKLPEILNYFRQELVKHAKNQFPGASDEEIVDLILAQHKEDYLPYVYIIDLTQEFKTETTKARDMMFKHLVRDCVNCIGDACIDRHPSQDKRREPCRLFTGVWNYTPTPCKLKACDENCEFAHNESEINYHPMKFKTKLCEFPFINGLCKERGMLCYCSHGDLRAPSPLTQVIKMPKNENEPRVENIPFSVDTFKTLPCKQTQSHDKPSCNFFHSDLSDRRRDPNKFTYSSTECPKAFGKELLCKFKDSCKFSHNELEKMYHKDVFNTIPCKKRPCNFEQCPFSHNEEPELKENVMKEWKNYKEVYERIKKEIESLELENEDFQCFKCIFCTDKPAELILACGHLSCRDCEHGDSCELCFIHIKPIIELKFN